MLSQIFTKIDHRESYYRTLYEEIVIILQPQNVSPFFKTAENVVVFFVKLSTVGNERLFYVGLVVFIGEQ